MEDLTQAYLVEGLLEFFGMETGNDNPTKNMQPNLDTLGKFVDTYIFPFWSGKLEENVQISCKFF